MRFVYCFAITNCCAIHVFLNLKTTTREQFSQISWKTNECFQHFADLSSAINCDDGILPVGDFEGIF